MIASFFGCHGLVFVMVCSLSEDRVESVKQEKLWKDDKMQPAAPLKVVFPEKKNC